MGLRPYASLPAGGKRDVSAVENIGHLQSGLARGGKYSFDPLFVFMTAMAAYVALQSLAALLSSGLLKALSYAVAFGIVLAMGTIAAFLPKQRNLSLGFGIALLLYFYGFIGSALVNWAALDFGTTIKMMLVPLFLLIGAKFEANNRFSTWEQRNTKQLFGLMIVLPLLLLLWQLATSKISFGGGTAFSIFANRNNAGLYAVSLIALLNVLRLDPVRSALLYCIVGVAFGTLGVLVAVVAALLIAVGNKRALIIVGGGALVLFAVLNVVPLEYGIFSRIKPVIESIKLITSGRIDIATVTYGELVGMLQTTDLSFLFRLKHWLYLWTLYINAPMENMVFGFGVGSSAVLSIERLIPHNDYLRMIFECGPVTLLGFVACIFTILKRCGRRWETVPLLTVSVYFVTENLIDNFAAMTIFFFCSGAMAYRISYKRGGENEKC